MRPLRYKSMLVMILAGFIWACGPQRATVEDKPPTEEQPASATADIAGKWVLANLAGAEVLPGTTLDLDGGKLGGNSGCNSYGGTYGLEGSTITLKGLTNTEMACADGAKMKQEGDFLSALAQATRVERKGDRLTLEGPGGKLVFERFDPDAKTPTVTLVGPTWALVTLYDGESASPPLAGTNITMTFEESGFSGNFGCNRATSAVTVEGSALTFEGVSLTRRACAGDDGPARMEQEADLMRRVGAITRYEIKGDRLILFAGDAASLELRASK